MSHSKDKHLSEAFLETLKDVYYAEGVSVKACKESAKAAQAPELKAAFEEHGNVSMQQIERLEAVFKTINESPAKRTCKAINGIHAEMEEDAKEFAGTPAGDAVLIGCAQAIEHYEIARYGLLHRWAEQLGNNEAAKLLAQTLAEEKQTDEKLSKLAETLNQAAMKQAA